MSELTDFLEARLAEDEVAARAASPGGWHYGDVESVAGGMLYDESRTIAHLVYEQRDDHDGSIVRHMLSAEADANGHHIARHDPARVLADVAAKRRMLELRYSWNLHAERAPDLDLLTVQVATADAIIRGFAAAYAEHPDFREEWR